MKIKGINTKDEQLYRMTDLKNMQRGYLETLRIICMSLLMLAVDPLWAKDFMCNGWTYTVLDEQAGVCGLKEINDDNRAVIKIPSTVHDGSKSYKVASILEGAFSNCENLTEVKIPESVKEIGSSAFLDCSSLVKVRLPKHLKVIRDWAFKECTSLTKVIIPETVETIEAMAFHRCESLNCLKLPESLDSIGYAAFVMCNGLRSVTIPERVSYLDGSVFTSINLEEIIVHPRNQSFVAVDGILFSKDLTRLVCYPAAKSDTSYTIPYGVKSIASGAFANNRNLTDVVIPETVKSIGEEAFAFSRSLRTIELHDSLSSNYAFNFSWCDSLKTVRFTNPRNISFYKSKNIERIFYTGEKPERDDVGMFDEEVYNKATLYVRKSILDDLRDLEPWCKFRKIEILEFSIPTTRVVETGIAGNRCEQASCNDAPGTECTVEKAVFDGGDTRNE